MHTAAQKKMHLGESKNQNLHCQQLMNFILISFHSSFYSEIVDAQNDGTEKVNACGKSTKDLPSSSGTTTTTKPTASTTASVSSSLNKRVQPQQLSNKENIDEAANNAYARQTYLQQYQPFYPQSNFAYDQSYSQPTPHDYYNNYYM